MTCINIYPHFPQHQSKYRFLYFECNRSVGDANTRYRKVQDVGYQVQGFELRQRGCYSAWEQRRVLRTRG